MLAAVIDVYHSPSVHFLLTARNEANLSETARLLDTDGATSGKILRLAQSGLKLCLAIFITLTQTFHLTTVHVVPGDIGNMETLPVLLDSLSDVMVSPPLRQQIVYITVALSWTIKSLFFAWHAHPHGLSFQSKETWKGICGRVVLISNAGTLGDLTKRVADMQDPAVVTNYLNLNVVSCIMLMYVGDRTDTNPGAYIT